METTYRPCILNDVREWTVHTDPERITGLADRVQARRRGAWVFEGPAGIGSSTLARAVGDALRERDFTVLEVFALPGLRDVPLGALMPLLAEPVARTDDEENAADRLQRLFARLARGTARTVLLVDDAASMDDMSSAAVHQLVQAYGVRCILTVRVGQTWSASLTRLADQGLVERVPVGPLDHARLAAQLEGAVGATVAPESLFELLERSAGHPLFLRLLLEACEDSDLVRSSERGIVLGSPPLPPRVAQIVREWIAPLTDTERVPFERLALARVLPHETLEPATLARLLTLGVAARDGDDVRMSHPLVAETVVADLPAPLREQRRREAATLLSDALALAPDDERRFALVELLARSADAPATAEVAWAAQAATWRGRHAQAVRLAERADALAVERGEDRPLEALILRGESLAILGRLDDADAAFEAALAAHTDDAGIALAASRASQYWAIRRHDSPRAAEIERTAAAAIRSEEARAFLFSATAKWRIMLGEATQLPASSGLLASSEAAAAAAALEPTLLATLSGVLSGHPQRTRDAIARGRPHAAAAQPIVRHAAELFDFAEAFLPALDGDLDRAMTALSAHATERMSEGAGMWNYALALLEYHAGRWQDASVHAATAVEQLAWRDLLAARGANLGLRAAIAAQQGDHGGAASLLRAVGPDLRRVVTADLQAAEAESWIAHRTGAPDPAAPIERAVDAAAGTGHDGWMAFTAHSAIRLGRPDRVLAVLRAIDPPPKARVFGWIVAHGEALQRGDAADLLRAADALEAAGIHAGAHDAARQALLRARETGRTDLARRARVVASRIGSALPPAITRADTGDVLSAREWDVATAAAARARNREIAERLGLSLRTVENHLASAYRKLGVSGRDELRELLTENPLD